MSIESLFYNCIYCLCEYDSYHFNIYRYCDADCSFCETSVAYCFCCCIICDHQCKYLTCNGKKTSVIHAHKTDTVNQPPIEPTIAVSQIV
jgi:hypothetical protein